MTTVEAFRGLHYPNKIGRLFYLSLEEVMGVNGVKALLRLAELPQFIDAYPPNDLKREYPLRQSQQPQWPWEPCMGRVVLVVWSYAPGVLHLRWG